MNLVSYIQVHIHKFSTIGGTNVTHMAPLSPNSSSTQSPVPSIVNNNPSTAVQYFGISVSLTLPSPSDDSVASVSINERAYYGPSFESNNNLLN